MNEYRTIRCEAVGEITEKKSRFIATLRPVETEEEALAFIADMKKKYWDARHNCSAYIIGTDRPLERCSDDGEPSRTAGMPMLEVLKGASLSNVCCVVTRYFGGVLLGTGGLVRAYGAAVNAGLKAADILICRQLRRIEYIVDYNSYGRLSYLITQDNLQTESTDFSSEVCVRLLLTDAQAAALSAKMTEATSGTCSINDLGLTWGFMAE